MLPLLNMKTVVADEQEVVGLLGRIRENSPAKYVEVVNWLRRIDEAARELDLSNEEICPTARNLGN